MSKNVKQNGTLQFRKEFENNQIKTNTTPINNGKYIKISISVDNTIFGIPLNCLFCDLFEVVSKNIITILLLGNIILKAPTKIVSKDLYHYLQIIFLL